MGYKLNKCIVLAQCAVRGSIVLHPGFNIPYEINFVSQFGNLVSDIFLRCFYLSWKKEMMLFSFWVMFVLLLLWWITWFFLRGKWKKNRQGNTIYLPSGFLHWYSGIQFHKVVTSKQFISFCFFTFLSFCPLIFSQNWAFLI